MADYSKTSDIEALQLQIQRSFGTLHVALVAKVLEFQSSAPQKCKVQPLQQLKVTLGDDVTTLSLPVIENVPVSLPYAQSLGMMLTLPIQPGDTGLLIIPDRSLENFLTSDGKNPVAPVFYGNAKTCAPRTHGLCDAIYIPGLSTYAQAIPNYNTTHIEIRDKPRKNYFSLGSDGLVFTDGACTVTIRNGQFLVKAPNGIQLTDTKATTEIRNGNIVTTCNNSTTTVKGDITTRVSGNYDISANGYFKVNADGTITLQTDSTMSLRSQNVNIDGTDNHITGNLINDNGTFIDSSGVNLNTHIHSGVDAGPSNTGSPVK